jgi:hypothetical protein
MLAFINKPAARGLCKLFVTNFFCDEGLLTTRPTQAGGRPLVICPRLLIQYKQLTCIAGGRSTIRNPRTRHAVGTGTLV